MNDPLPYGTQRTEKLLGIVDMKCNLVECASFNVPHDAQIYSNLKLFALFRYEIRHMRLRQGGQLILDGDPTYRDEWREVTEHGCFPSVQQKYKVT